MRERLGAWRGLETAWNVTGRVRGRENMREDEARTTRRRERVCHVAWVLNNEAQLKHQQQQTDGQRRSQSRLVPSKLITSILGH